LGEVVEDEVDDQTSDRPESGGKLPALNPYDFEVSEDPNPPFSLTAMSMVHQRLDDAVVKPQQ